MILKMKRGNKLVSQPNDAELQKFKEIAKALPEIRQEKISAIRKQIKSGRYTVDASAVAKSIIERYCEIRSIIRPDKDAH